MAEVDGPDDQKRRSWAHPGRADGANSIVKERALIKQVKRRCYTEGNEVRANSEQAEFVRSLTLSEMVHR